ELRRRPVTSPSQVAGRTSREAGYPASAASAIDTSIRMTSATERQSPRTRRFGRRNSRASAASQVRQVLLTSGERPRPITAPRSRRGLEHECRMLQAALAGVVERDVGAGGVDGGAVRAGVREGGGEVEGRDLTDAHPAA